MPTRKCQVCGAGFQPSRKNEIYCSRRCYRQRCNETMVLKRRAVTRDCSECGQEFSGHGLAASCSEKCKLARRMRLRAERREKAKQQVTCEVCGEAFRRRSANSICCSESCSVSRKASLRVQQGSEKQLNKVMDKLKEQINE